MAESQAEYVVAEPLSDSWWTGIGIDIDTVDVDAAREQLRQNLEEYAPDAEIIIAPQSEWGTIRAARHFDGEVEWIEERCDQDDPLFYIYYHAASSVTADADED